MTASYTPDVEPDETLLPDDDVTTDEPDAPEDSAAQLKQGDDT